MQDKGESLILDREPKQCLFVVSVHSVGGSYGVLKESRDTLKLDTWVKVKGCDLQQMLE